MDKEVAKIYGDQVRVRACGICLSEGGLLMVNHRGITSGDFWAPPGGGVEFGQSVEETLKKEFLEETGIEIRPLQFMFGCEYIAKPIHSIELFYATEITGGKLKTGHDPEIQIITDAKFIAAADLIKIRLEELHGIFRLARSPDALRQLRGFYRI